MHTAEVENQVLTEHILRHVDERHIRTHRVAVLISRPVLGRFASHAGPVTLERVGHIGIDRRAVALQLPVSRYGNLSPLAHVVVHMIEILRPFLRVPAPVEKPLPVE